jgi:hypothetical protein
MTIARTADFFQAIGVESDWGRGLAIARDWPLGDIAQADDDVHVRTPRELILFPVRFLAGRLLTLYLDDDLFVIRHGSSNFYGRAGPGVKTPLSSTRVGTAEAMPCHKPYL